MVKKQVYSRGMQYYVDHLTLISIMLPESKKLTPAETGVLAAFMYVYNGLFDKHYVTFETKKKVRELLGISSASISMYIKRLSELQYLQRVDNSKDFDILESIIPDPDTEKYMIVLHKIEVETKDEID